MPAEKNDTPWTEDFALGTPALVCRWRLADRTLPLENRHLRALSRRVVDDAPVSSQLVAWAKQHIEWTLAEGAAACPDGTLMLVVDEVSRDGAAREMVDIVDPYLTHRLSGEPVELLVKMVERGSRCGEPEGIEVARERCREALMRLDPAVARFLNPQTYPVGLELGLAELRSRLAREERAESGRPTA